MTTPATTSQDQSATDDSQPAELVFIKINQPGDVKRRDYRKQVRSHVARWQHREKTRVLLPQRSATEPSGESELAPEDPNRQHDTSTHALGCTTEISDLPDAGNGGSTQLISQFFARENAAVLPPAAIAADLDIIISMNITLQSPLARAFSQGTAAFQTFALHDTANIAGIALGNLGIHASSVLGFYDALVLRQATDIQAQYEISPPVSNTHKAFMSFVFNDPILLTMAMLISVVKILRDLSSVSVQRHILQVHTFLIRSINMALEDTARSISDEMLVCITLFAGFEIKHGSMENYHLHMRGLMEMISLRGGMRAIGEQNPGLAMLLVWHDINSAELAGCNPYCQSLERPLELESGAANLQVFTSSG